MRQHTKARVLHLLLLTGIWQAALPVRAADLSPLHWPEAGRAAAEKAEATSPSPLTARTVSGASGLVVSTLSPIAALAGIQTLKNGGNAADAAIATALTQITTALGTNISFAGIMEMVYYDAGTHRTFTLSAGWDTWSGETDRASIPVDAVTATLWAPGQAAGPVASGRRTLVPGFMAGMDALHARLGRLRRADLFAPAIYYARHGVTISPGLHAYFTSFAPYLSATPAGRRFMQQAGGDVPQVGARFIQADLAATLQAVARRGAREMYSGAWARDFVAAVSQAGGRAALEDLKRYHVQWGEPAHGVLRDFDIQLSPATVGGQAMLESFALMEHTGLLQQPPYSQNADSLLSLSRILTWSSLTASVPAVLDPFRAAGVDVSLAGRQAPAYATAVKPVLNTLFLAPPPAAVPVTTPHSASVVVVDKEGNVASLVHSSNTLAWGSTGLVVGGIPIPSAAGLSAVRFPQVKPGERLPHEMAPLIAFKEGKPVLAVAAVGSSLLQASVAVLLDTLLGGQDLSTSLGGPRLLLATSQPQATGAPRQAIQVPQGAYSRELLERLRARGVNVKECSPREVVALQGTAAVAQIQPGAARSADVVGVYNFVSGY